MESTIGSRRRRSMAMSAMLEQIIDQYLARYGEPGYRYSKKYIQWTKFRRQRGYHSSPCGPGTEVSKAEYEANTAQSKKNVLEAFMGRFPQSYWRYDKELSKDGWREVLIKEVQAARPEAHGT